MKKAYLIFIFIMAVVFVSGCGPDREYNLKPDDELSRSIKEALGKDFYYHGRDENRVGEIWYSYQIKSFEPEAVRDFVRIVNDYAMNTDSEPIEVVVYSKIPGALDPCFKLKNFSEGDADPDYSNEMYWLHIYGGDISFNPSVCEPSFYTQIEGIRELYIDKEMQEKAEEEGIDWYSCWPTLEKVTVVE